MVRDTVTRDLQVASSADVVDALQRLLARARALLHHQRLLHDALEEMLPWLLTPPNAEVLNGPTLDARIWQAVAREASHGSNPSPSATSTINQAPMVLLQPGFPVNHAAIHDELPGMSSSVIAGLRRRAWQQHVASLGPNSTGAGVEGEGQDVDLFLIHLDPTRRVPVPPGCPPFASMPLNVAHGRRRARVPRAGPAVANHPSTPQAGASVGILHGGDFELAVDFYNTHAVFYHGAGHRCSCCLQF